MIHTVALKLSLNPGKLSLVSLLNSTTKCVPLIVVGAGTTAPQYFPSMQKYMLTSALRNKKGLLYLTFANSLDPAQARYWVCSGSKLFDTDGIYEICFRKKDD